MNSDSRDVDRLIEAIEAHHRFLAEDCSHTVSEFLAAHEHLRDLLEPLLNQARPAPPPNAPGARVLGDFRLLGELGRGGMGVVYDAEQISLGRHVAVKVLPSRLALDPDRRVRFARESRLAASLDHPGIAKVISADVDDDVIWFAMERIDGAPLDRVLRRTADTQVASMTGGLLQAVVDEVTRQHGDDVAAVEPVTGSGKKSPESSVWRSGHVDTVVRIGAQIADALHYAHQHGVIHRDVKPANVLLRRDGSAVLTDFGLARDLNEPSLTLTGDFMGTPSYSAPEQLAGDRAVVDHRVDIFALGVTLYELLTHRRPFEASTTEEVRARILATEPQRPRRLNSKIPRDLDSVLQKALEKDPNRRYQTAAEMGEDLLAVGEGRTVRARPVRAHTRVLRWCRRNPWATATIALLVGVALLLLAMSEQLVHAKHESSIRAGVALARANDFRSALAELMPLERQLRGPATQTALSELFRLHPCLASDALVSGSGERVLRARFSSDGQWVVTQHEFARPNERVRWHLEMRRVLAPGPRANQSLQRWKSDPCLETSSFTIVGSEPTVAWTKDLHTVAVGGPQRETTEISFQEAVIRLLPASAAGRFGVAFEKSVRLCNVDGTVEREWPRPADATVAPVIFADLLIRTRLKKDGGYELVSDAAGAVSTDLGDSSPQIVFDPGDPTRMVITTDNVITAWRRTSDGLELTGRHENLLPKKVLVARLSTDDRESEDQERFAELALWRTDPLAARFFPQQAERSREPYIVAVEAQALRLWLAPEPRQLDLKGSELEITRFESAAPGLDPAARRLWCAGIKTLAAWSFDAEGVGSREDVELSSETVVAAAARKTPNLCGIAFDPGRAILACARYNDFERAGGEVFVLPTGDRPGIEASVVPCSSRPNWIELSRDRRLLAVAGSDGAVDLWTYDSQLGALTDRGELAKLHVDAMRLSCVRFLGSRFLLASEGGPFSAGGILCWDLEDRDAQPVRVTPTIHQKLRCLAISHDGPFVAAGGDDRIVRVMRVVMRDGRAALGPPLDMSHPAAVLAVAFARRGDAWLLASADRRGGIRLWDPATGEPRGVLRGTSESEDEMILSLDFSPDGRHLAAAQHGGRVLLWDLDRARRCIEGNRACAEKLLRLRVESR